MEVAADSTASSWARVAALRSLLWSKAPSQARYRLSEMLTPPRCAEGCRSSCTGHYYSGSGYSSESWPWPAFGAAMPADYVDRIDALATRIANSDGAPGDVRAAARHVSGIGAEREDLKGR